MVDHGRSWEIMGDHGDLGGLRVAEEEDALLGEKRVEDREQARAEAAEQVGDGGVGELLREQWRIVEGQWRVIEGRGRSVEGHGRSVEGHGGSVQGHGGSWKVSGGSWKVCGRSESVT